MSASKLLNRLAQQNLLSPGTIEKVRQQVDASSQPVTAEALVKLLVKKTLLTADQGRRVLKELAGEASSSPLPPSYARPVDPDDNLGLRPDVDDRPESPSAGHSDEVLSVDEAIRPTKRSSPNPPNSRERKSGPMPPPVGETRRPSDAHEEETLEVYDESSGDTFPADAMEEVGGGRAIPSRRRGLAGLLAQLRPAGGRRKFAANRWDSPIILVGGGSLLLLLAIALGLYFFLARGTGDDAFNLANEDYRQQAYGQAITHFQQFVRDFPGHPKESLAKVRMATAGIWSQVERKNWDAALENVQTQLPAIESEEAFGEARPELASLLPEIMDGFATEAVNAPDVPSAESRLAKAEVTLKEVDNPSYLPSSVRRGQQPRIEQILGKLESVRRRINQDRELEKTITEMQELTQKKQIPQAYAARDTLLRKYPNLELDSRLDGAIKSVTDQEKAVVQRLTELPQATKDPVRTSAADFEVVLSHRRGESIPSVKDQVYCAVLGESAFAVSAEDGHLLWRRDLGATQRQTPIEIDGPAGGDLLLVDARRNELLRVSASTGKTVWRLPCPSTPLLPTFVGGQVYFACADKEGSLLLAIDPATGQATGGVRLPVPITTGPTVDAERKVLIQVADHSSVYQINLQDWSCTAVYYLGHEAGTITVPPVVQAATIVCAENAGPDFALLHVLGEDAEKPGELRKLMDPIRQDGQIVVPMHAFGRRILLTNNRGKLQVWELDRSQAAAPLRLNAEAVGAVPPNSISYALMEDGRLWVGDSQLTYYEFQASRGQFARKWLNLKGDRFVAPLRRRGSVLLHVRQRMGRAAMTIGATQLGDVAGGKRDGEIVWETEVAMSPVGAPFVPEGLQEIRVITQDGLVLSAGKDAIRDGLVTQARGSLMNPLSGQLDSIVPLKGEQQVLTGRMIPDRVVLYDGATSELLRVVNIETGGAGIAAAPAMLGQGLVVPTTDGAVHLVDPTTGKPLAAPFLPSLSASSRVDWWPALATLDGRSSLLVDRRNHVFRIKMADAPPARLQAEREIQMDSPAIAPPVLLGNTLCLVVRGEPHDLLRRYRGDDLQLVDQKELPGRITWGPFLGDSRIWLQVDEGTILSFDEGSNETSLPLQGVPLVGPPAAFSGRVVLTGVNGQLLDLDEATGAERQRLELMVRLGTGAVPFSGNRFIVCGGDGTLYIATLPSK